MAPTVLLSRSSTAAAAAVLAGLLLPGSRRVVRLPDVARREFEPWNADMYQPVLGSWPAVLLVLGAVREGRRYPLLEQTARAIAACGFTVLVPELGRLRELVLGVDALDDLIAAVEAMPGMGGVRGERVGLVGFSLGGSLALLAAADPRLAGRIACVATMGGYFDLEALLESATCSTVAAPSAYAIAASLIAMLPRADGERLESALAAHPEAPLDAIGEVDPEGMSDQARAVLSLLRNRDPHSVPVLLRRVEGAAEHMAGLSPRSVLDRVSVPVWALHDERDRYVPVAQLRLMREAASGRRNFTFMSVRLLEHTEPTAPRLDLTVMLRDYLPGLLSLFRFVRGPLREVRRANR